MGSLKKNEARRGSLSFGESQGFGILDSAHSCSSLEVHCDSRGFPALSRPQFQIKAWTWELLGSNRRGGGAFFLALLARPFQIASSRTVIISMETKACLQSLCHLYVMGKIALDDDNFRRLK